jgi:cytosine/adenosine deaminase-related metal-dependent hydrolase
MATVNGAKACGLRDSVGSLEEGKAADIVLLSRRSVHLVMHNDVIGQLVFCENGRSVDTVFVGGELVVHRGQLVTLDYRRLLREAARRWGRESPLKETSVVASPINMASARTMAEFRGLCPSTDFS